MTVKDGVIDPPKDEEEKPQDENSEGDQPPAVNEPDNQLIPVEGSPLDRLIQAQHNDAGNVERLQIFLEEMCAGDEEVLYVEEWKEWITWDGSIWVPDKGNAKITRLFWGAIKGLAKDVLRVPLEYFHQTDSNTAQKKKNKLLSHLSNSLNSGKISSAISLASTLYEWRASSADLDRDPYMCACENGYINLKTGKLEEAKPQHFITKKLNATFDKGAKFPRWDNFVKEILPDEEVAEFTQKFFGYSFTGDVKEHLVLNLTGNGFNGKSVLTNASLNVAGTYGVKVPPDVITRAGRASGGDESKASPQTAMLQGARFSLTSELETNAWIAESKLKDLASSDPITCRRLRKDPETFLPTHHLIFASNSPPNVKGTDLGVWRRLMRVKFEQTIQKPDKSLEERFATDEARSHILNWLLNGVEMFLKDREAFGELHIPDKVKEWNNQYKQSEDVLQQFVEDHCNVGDLCEASQAVLRLLYEQWAGNNGYRPFTTVALNKALEQRGFRRRASNGVRLWEGVEINFESIYGTADAKLNSIYAEEGFMMQVPKSHIQWWEKYVKEAGQGDLPYTVKEGSADQFFNGRSGM